MAELFPCFIRGMMENCPLLAARRVNEDCFSQMFLFKIHIHFCFNLTYPNVDTRLDQIVLHQLHCRHSTWVANINSFDLVDDIILFIYSSSFNHTWTQWVPLLISKHGFTLCTSVFARTNCDAKFIGKCRIIAICKSLNDKWQRKN